ncbi:MAG: winged helix-turn-helix domain-containing protein [Actinobacteria bacterium]|nr:winged helix-turn-helix domain-containing protein [Actinomycetota bacterium]
MLCYRFGVSDWSFLTNHARVLLAIAADPELRLREIADAVGISERRVHGIVTDLTDSGYLTKEREGRRNRYAIHTQRPLSQDLGDRGTVGDLVALLAAPDDEPDDAA